ncbi:hypothetical protein [Nitrosopumilus sp. S4]
MNIALADVWEIQIPTDASKIDSKAHFIPLEISIRPNDMVVWGNGDGAIHTITSGSLETGSDGKFDSGFLNPGRQFLKGFGEEYGEYKYFCTIHPWMTGIINVVDLPEGFHVFHNVGSKVADTSFDIQYKVQRNLSEIIVDPTRKMLVFNFVGKIDNDVFIIHLPQELIKNPQTVWVGNEQIMNFISESTNEITKMSIPLEGHTSQVKIVGSSVIGETPKKPYLLINQVFTTTDKKAYNPGDTITISGEIKNINQLNTITANIISPAGVTIYSKDIALMGSRFTVEVNTEILRNFGEYKIEYQGKDMNAASIHFNYELQKEKNLSPKKQMHMVEHASDVVCNEGLELLKKKSNGNAVCLSKDTAKILVQRGWAGYF